MIIGGHDGWQASYNQQTVWFWQVEYLPTLHKTASATFLYMNQSSLKLQCHWCTVPTSMTVVSIVAVLVAVPDFLGFRLDSMYIQIIAYTSTTISSVAHTHLGDESGFALLYGPEATAFDTNRYTTRIVKDFPWEIPPVLMTEHICFAVKTWTDWKPITCCPWHESTHGKFTNLWEFYFTYS